WTYSAHGAGWGTAVLVWSAAVGLVDNFLKPILIKRGADLPLLVIFAGVIGGLIGFGVIGLFVGPVILGVTYTLLRDWMQAAPAAESGFPSPPAREIGVTSLRLVSRGTGSRYPTRRPRVEGGVMTRIA